MFKKIYFCSRYALSTILHRDAFSVRKSRFFKMAKNPKKGLKNGQKPHFQPQNGKNPKNEGFTRPKIPILTQTDRFSPLRG